MEGTKLLSPKKQRAINLTSMATQSSDKPVRGVNSFSFGYVCTQGFHTTFHTLHTSSNHLLSVHNTSHKSKNPITHTLSQSLLPTTVPTLAPYTHPPVTPYTTQPLSPHTPQHRSRHFAEARRILQSDGPRRIESRAHFVLLPSWRSLPLFKLVAPRFSPPQLSFLRE